MTTTLTEQTIPTGTWTLDTVHSTVGYAVRHSGVSLFKGTVDGFDAKEIELTVSAEAKNPKDCSARRSGWTYPFGRTLKS